MKGNPLTLIGPELQAGDHAPDFSVVDGTLSAVNLEKTGHNVRIISVVPSLDTPVCDLQTKRFNEEAAKMPGVDIVTISMDLPFAQKRWCGAFGVDRIKMLSDHRSGSFGEPGNRSHVLRCGQTWRRRKQSEIVLLHDGGHLAFGVDRSHTVAATSILLEKYADKRFVTVSGLSAAETRSSL